MQTLHTRRPDFSQLLKVLRGERPDRPTLFEFYLNEALYEQLAGRRRPPQPPSLRTATDTGSSAARREAGTTQRVSSDELAYYRRLGRWYADAFAAAGYDYVNLTSTAAFPGFAFVRDAHQKEHSVSLNEGGVIASWDDVHAYDWPDASRLDPSVLDAVTDDVPDGMMALMFTPGGVLENLIDLVGYDNLCYMLVDDRSLVAAIARKIGESLAGLYELIADHPRIGALIANDDWGFKTQTMVAPDDLREFVFPWYRRITSIVHEAGKPILLHSCGQLREVMDDVIDQMHFDAKHSFEDVILPVEEAYERWGDRIAVLGGIDVDFLCHEDPDAITARSKAMLERAFDRGGYALGSGNSIPEYVPDESYFAMIRAALE
jgi:uroporphyrinogen decarboxylase